MDKTKKLTKIYEIFRKLTDLRVLQEGIRDFGDYIVENVKEEEMVSKLEESLLYILCILNRDTGKLEEELIKLSEQKNRKKIEKKKKKR